MGMAESNMRMPSAGGGIVRYDAEYKSRFMLTPAAVIGFVVFVLVCVFLIKVFFPTSA